MLTRRYWIGGRVQGVGFRYFVVRAAEETGVKGWVRNLADGRVEALAQGAEAALGDFESRLRMGPRFAEVRTFEVRDAEPERLSGFQIR